MRRQGRAFLGGAPVLSYTPGMVFNKYRPLAPQLRAASRKQPKEILGNWGPRQPEVLVTLDAASTYSRSPLYRAERRLHRTIKTPWVFTSTGEVLDYVRGVSLRATDSYSKSSFPISVREGEPGQAAYQSGVILTPFPVRQVIILHELAHHLSGPTQGHGAAFMGPYVYLLRLEMGDEIAERLLDNLQQTS